MKKSGSIYFGDILLAREAHSSRRGFSINSTSTLCGMQSHTQLVIEVDTELQGDYYAEIVGALN